MDSFYDVPRRVPAPTMVEKMNIRPAVPEVSLICPSIPNPNSCDRRLLLKGNSGKPELPYSNFYGTENTLKDFQNYSNGNILQTSQSRKQVRFESPVLQQRPSLTYEPFATKKKENPEVLNSLSVDNHQDNMAITKNSNKPQKQTFQEIYMANIPNRHLDLSIIDIPKDSATKVDSTASEAKQKNKENELPKTYKEFLETQKKISKAQKKDKTVTDILNYKRQSLGILNETPPNFANSYSNDMEISSNQLNVSTKHSQKHNQSNVPSYQYATSSITNSAHSFSREKIFPFDQNNRNTLSQKRRNTDKYYCGDNDIPRNEISYIGKSYATKECSRSNDSCEPTNRDLLKIIAQQNEQLLLLQKQVALLLNREHNCHNKPIEPATKNDDRNNINSEPNRFIPEINLTPRKHALSKFSVDVMTSFEVAIRPQHNRQLPPNYNSSKIQEITEESNICSSADLNKNSKEHSLHLQEPMKVMEPCQSPEPSININMNDYDSSDDEVSASEIGATFYHNLMEQVNNILKQAQIQTRDDLCSKGLHLRKNITCSKTNVTMHRVREATLKHLKDIGVTIEPLEDDNIISSSDSDNREYSPTEISHGVKQLLMKYLPHEHLARTMAKSKQQKHIDRDRSTEDTDGRKETKHDFSFASLQYMKKYNLIPSGTQEKIEKLSSEKPTDNNRKILDLTALKMQPKLL